VCIDEHKLLVDIEKLLKQKISKTLEPGFDVDPNIAAEPIQNGRNTRFAGAKQQRGPRPQGNSFRPKTRSY
jgi:ATP-dependent RNA helicase RhlE